jgi:hypothetical protein
MTLMIVKDYGAFAPIVSTAGSIMAMGAAITLGFKGRAKWEPVEEDVAKGPQKVASIVAALLIVLVWVQFNDVQYENTLTRLVIWCSSALILSLLVYGLLKGYVYTRVRKKPGSAPTSKATEEIKVIGGLWLTKAARKRLSDPEEPDAPGQQAPLTVQRLFAMTDYDKDLLWSRPSQQLASMLFTIGYLGLIIAGTVALGSGAILTGVTMK